MQKIALLDWDRSLHRNWTIEDWLKHLARRERIAADVPAGWHRLRGRYPEELSHDQLAVQANDLYARSVAGLDVRTLAIEARAFVEGEDAARILQWVPALLQELWRRDVEPVVVTGAPHVVVEEHARRLGISHVLGLVLEARDGRLTGRLEARPGTSESKRRVVADLVASGWRPVLAVGDSESDRPLLDAAPAQLIIGNRALRDVYALTAFLVEEDSTAAAVELAAQTALAGA